jgi:hypothetical protein
MIAPSVLEPSVTLKLAFAVLALSCASAQAQEPGPPPAPDANVTELPGVTVTPAVPAAPCKEADRACYAVVAHELKTKYPEVYWKMAQRCMAEETQYASRRANPLYDGSGLFGGGGEFGDINPQSPGERTFCAIAQSDAKPPPKVKP